ncbi:pyroglutamyl-peptidase 1-like protein isoform X2 [Perognathus longimembris pacificus]|uniref:pyroglutamyl-peptidase 1-like protein isoform X2 n=1 Tax=Perognathus longimembris pacificus TaxID=214514 RepID=UPI002018FBB1|nr:pyroglutamyl-peptidase 1-like protein isoform X2 [Perognathus longimembris pacificus]
MEPPSSCVVVTGFGPFRQHLVNSSWEAVKELAKLGLGTRPELELHISQLPVDYREAERRVASIWEDLHPQLAVHVGMDSSAKVIFLEQYGKNRGYRDADIRGFRPEDDTSAITSTTRPSITEMGTQSWSTSLRSPVGSQPACWGKPCKSLSRKCWKRMGKAQAPSPVSGKVEAQGLQPNGTNCRKVSFRGKEVIPSCGQNLGCEKLWKNCL